MTVKRMIKSKHLTTCDVIDDGEAIRLNLINQSGHSVSVEMTIEQAESIVMTLPQLLSKALKARTKSESTRYVFPMDEWSIESTASAECLIVTLKTTDGFQVAFGMAFSTCQALGYALKREGNVGMAQSSLNEGPAPERQVLLN